MNQPLLDVQGLSKHFGGFTALDNVSLHVNQGERFGLIGPNGSGKTTMINCISGALLNESGKVVFQGRDISRLKPHQRTHLGIARSFQLPKPFASMTVLENLCIPLEFATSTRTTMAQRREEGMEILELIGLADKAEDHSGGLTQIDMRKLELARAMAAKPDLLISDEAMAGLSGSEVDEILERLFAMNERGVGIIMIEHVMKAVMRFSQRIVVLDAGNKIAEGTPGEVVSNPLVEKAYLGE